MEQRPKNILPVSATALAVVLLIGALIVPVPVLADSFQYQYWTGVPVHQIHLPNDHILLWGYSGYSAWVWDISFPLQIPHIEKPNFTANVFCSGHAALANGNYVVIGGIDIPAGQFTSPATELFDISTTPGDWVSLPDMAAARFYPTATTLGDGRIIASGGAGTGADVPEIYDPSSNSWSTLPSSAQKNLGVYPFMFLLPDGNLFFAGPREDPGPMGANTTDTYTLDLATSTWNYIDTSANDGASAVMYEPGKIMKCGGFDSANNVTEIIDLNSASPMWTNPPSGNMMFARHDHSLTILPDGTVLAAGGHPAIGTPVEIWDPQTLTWTTKANLVIPRQYHSTSMLLRDGRVVVGGGDGFASVEFYSPDYLSAGNRPTINTVPSQINYNQPFIIKWGAFSNIAKVTLLRLGAETHSFDQNQRYMELTFTLTGPIGINIDTGAMAGSMQVQAPSTSNIAPPGYYMVFLVDNQGVPSVGEYVLLN